jgi:hypothetical protein
VSFSPFKNVATSWALVLTPVIIATQEAEIRKIAVRSQPWTNTFGDPILKIPNAKKG